MKILVSNDDGVFAPGISALAEALTSLESLTSLQVVAPDRNRSGASNSLTLDNPLRVKHLKNGFYSVEGTPTDCVHLAITGLLDEQPDMVVSGINAGANLGDDVLYSGTVAAATEGRFLGLPAIAISLVSDDYRHYATAAKVALILVEYLAKKPLDGGYIFNVNVPDVPYDALNGFEVTRLGTRHCAEPTVKQVDPRGNIIYWVGPPGLEHDNGPGTDFYAVSQQKVSITPIQLDLTDHSVLPTVNAWLDNIDL